MEVGVISGPSLRGDTLNLLGWWLKLPLYLSPYGKITLLVRKMGKI